jgi:TATA-binding protein-associated factor Taf7
LFSSRIAFSSIGAVDSGMTDANDDDDDDDEEEEDEEEDDDDDEDDVVGQDRFSLAFLQEVN